MSEGAAAAKPKNFDWAEAASLPLVGLTAWQALIDLGGLKPAQKVLIHAGAGGVGTFAIQLAKHHPHVTKTPGVCDGKACIDGTRIRVNNVVFLHKEGANDEKILEAYPDLTPAQIHAALAYYYDNREEIDAELAANVAWAESLDE